MWLKVVIVGLFIALVISLFTDLGFLMKKPVTGRRTTGALWVRLVLTMLLVGFLFYGVFTGQLGSNAPWDARYAKDKHSETPVEKDSKTNEQP